jgi:MSHA biogenesis protein MshP
MSRSAHPKRQTGFLLMAAVFLVVVVGAFVGYLATQSNVQQMTSTSDLNSARAIQAARAGIEWAAYQALRNASCAGTTLTFSGTSLAAFTSTVSCSSSTYTEGSSTITVYQVTSTACNVTNGGAPFCPNSSAAPPSIYVERQLTLTMATCTPNC